MAADLVAPINGVLTYIYLGENTTEAKRQADLAAGYAGDIALLNGPAGADYLDYDGRSVGDVLAELEYGDGFVISNFAASPAEVEDGATISVDLSWTITGTITGQTLTDSVAGAVTLADPVADRAVTITGVNSTRTLTLVATNTGAPGGADSKNAVVAITKKNRRFWGTSASATLDSAGVLALSGSELSNSRAKTFTLDGGAGLYFYEAYIGTLGAPSGYKINSFDETPAVQTGVSVTTAAGLNANYTIVRSPNPLIGSNTVEIA